MDLPNKRPDDMVRITTPELAQKFIEEQVALIREQVKDKKVLQNKLNDMLASLDY